MKVWHAYMTKNWVAWRYDMSTWPQLDLFCKYDMFTWPTIVCFWRFDMFTLPNNSCFEGMTCLHDQQLTCFESMTCLNDQTLTVWRYEMFAWPIIDLFESKTCLHYKEDFCLRYDMFAWPPKYWLRLHDQQLSWLASMTRLHDQNWLVWRYGMLPWPKINLFDLARARARESTGRGLGILRELERPAGAPRDDSCTVSRVGKGQLEEF